MTTLGTGANGTWARAADQDTWAEVPSAFVWVEQGTASGRHRLGQHRRPGRHAGHDRDHVGAVLRGRADHAGAGLTKTGNTIDVVGTANRITVAPTRSTSPRPTSGRRRSPRSARSPAAPGTGRRSASRTAAPAGAPLRSARTALDAVGYYNNAATHGAGTTITITTATHGLRATRGIIVQVQDNTTGAVEWPDVVVASGGDVTITYAVSVSRTPRW